MQPIYTSFKVHNEIELCEINDPECKAQIEKLLLSKRISYFIRWPKNNGFHLRRNKNLCILCINENSSSEAEEVIRSLCDEKGYTVRFLKKHTKNEYF